MRHAFVAAFCLTAVVTVFAQRNTGRCDFKNFRVPVPHVYDTAANGINRSGTIVGMYTVPKKYQGYWVTFGHGFMLNQGQYYPIDVPGRAQTQPFALNDRNEVVGDSWPGYSGPPKGFLLDASGYHELDFPGYYDVFPFSINNHGQIVGMMTSATTQAEEGFLFENKQLHGITFPGSTWSIAVGINEARDMVGNYGVGNAVYHGFLLRSGTFSTLDYPGAYETILWAINDEGVVVGSYFMSPQSSSKHFKWKAGQFEDLPNDCRGDICAIQTNFVSLNESGQFAGNFYGNGVGYAEGFVAACK